MKPHPKIRKTVKWAGVVVSVMLVVVAVGSVWWKVSWGNMFWDRVSIGNGRVTLLGGQESADTVLKLRAMNLRIIREDGLKDFDHRFRLGLVPPGFSLWFDRDTGTNYWQVRAPIWVFVIPVVAFTVAACRLDSRPRRRTRAGHCLKCNYNRRGISAQTVCPECGKAPMATSGLVGPGRD